MTQEVIMVDPVQLFPGFMLADPSYVVTDLLICVFSIYEWAKLRRFWNRPRTIYQQLFLAYFLLMAIATLSAALLSHGFRLYLTAPAFNYPSWLLNILSLSCFALATIERSNYLKPLRPRKWMIGMVILVTLGMMVWTVISNDFLAMEAHIGFCVVVISTPLQFRFIRRKECQLLLVTTLLLLPTPVVSIFNLGLAPWCDFYDVIHLLITAAMYASYRSCLAQEQPFVTCPASI